MNTLNFKNDFFYPYLIEAPVALALERTLECEIIKNYKFDTPVLDIGCGEGMFAHLLFKDKVDVGIDPNPKELKRAKEYGAYKELICCFGDKIPKESKSFSTVFSNSVLEHIPDLKPVLLEVHRLMKDEAKFIVTIPTDQFEQNTLITKTLTILGLTNLAIRYRAFFNRFWQHYHAYSIPGWKALFLDAGFEVEYSQTYCPPAVGIFNDVFSPIAILAFFQKKFANKWFVFPWLRSAFARLWSVLYFPLTKVPSNPKNDGLVFFVLKKSRK